MIVANLLQQTLIPKTQGTWLKDKLVREYTDGNFSHHHTKGKHDWRCSTLIYTTELWLYTILTLIYGIFQLLERKILNIYLIRSNSWNEWIFEKN